MSATNEEQPDAMRLIYLSNARLPSEKGNSVQSMQQCEALGRRASVEFWYPFRHNAMSSDDLFAFYGVAPTFTLRRLPSWDLPALRRLWPRLGFLVQSLSFSAGCAGRLLRERGAAVYTRNEFDLVWVPLLAAVRGALPVFFEDHDGFLRRPSPLRRFLIRSLAGVIVTTAAHAESYLANGISGDRLLIAPNGVAPERFRLPPREAAGEARRIVYVGNLFPWKGVYTLAEAVRSLPAEYALTIVGGSPEAADPFRAFLAAQGLNGRVTLAGYVPPPEVASHLAGADILVLPNSARHPLSSTFTSPLKLFEYMATGRPIVAADVPAVAGILIHERNAILVKPDDAQALAEGILTIGEDPALGARLAAQASRDVAPYSWEARTEKVMRFIDAPLGDRMNVQTGKNGAPPLSARERWLIRHAVGSMILDVGFAGQKRSLPAYHALLRRREGRLIGIDISERAVAGRAQPDALVADAGTLPFRTGSIDCVILGEFLEHHLDVAPFLAESHRVLRDGGTLLVTTPNPYALSRFVKRWLLPAKATLGSAGNAASALGHEDHRALWDPLTLCALLSRTGIVVEEVTTLGIWLPWVGRLIPSLRRGMTADLWPLNRFGHVTCIRGRKPAARGG